MAYAKMPPTQVVKWDRLLHVYIDGRTIAHGTNVTAFLNSSESEGLTCQNGVLSRPGNFASCQVGAPASYIINGTTIPHGGHITLNFKARSYDSQGCSTEVRFCTNGVLSGSASLSSCTIATHYSGATSSSTNILYPNARTPSLHVMYSPKFLEIKSILEAASRLLMWGQINFTPATDKVAERGSRQP